MNKLLEFPPFRLDMANAILWRNDQSISLRPKILEVLCYLVERHGQLVSKDDLLKKVWQSRCVEEAVLKVCINELRQALGDNSHSPRFIATVARRGYRFIASVTEVKPASTIENFCFDVYDRDKAPGRAVYGVDRNEAQVKLLATWEMALQGLRQITFVTGEAGIGKTTLIEMFLNKVSDSAPNVLRTRCIEHLGQGEALLPLLEAIERNCRGIDGSKLVELLWSRAPTWLAQLPSILKPGEQEVLQSTIFGAGWERMVREGCELLETLSRNKPLILIIEDLHWSDNTTLDFLSLLTQRNEPVSLLVIATYRSVDAHLQTHPVLSVHRKLGHRGISKEIAINPFSVKEINSFLSQRFPGTDIPAAVNQSLYDRTGGNPLFVTNLIEYLINQYQWSPFSSNLAVNEVIPDTIRRVIERELESLSSDELTILNIASVIGVQFSILTIASVTHKAASTIDNCCDALAKRKQILLLMEGMEKCSDGIVGRYIFRHALFVDVIYSQLAPAELIRLHLHIGEALEMQHDYNKDLKHAAILALHFEKGWDWNRAINYLKLAANNASLRFANFEAHGYLIRALNLVHHLPKAQEIETKMMLLKQSAKTRQAMGDMQGAYLDLENMLDTARASNNHRAEVLALNQLSHILIWLDRSKCLKQAEEALLCSKNLSDPVLQSTTSGTWGALNILFGRWQKEYADACYDAMAFARGTNNPMILHTRLTQHAIVELLASRYRESWMVAEEAMALSRTLGDGYMFMVDHYFGGLALLHLGKWGKLRLLYEQSIKAFEWNNASEPFRLHYEIVISWLHAEAGDFVSAKIRCEKAYADSVAASAIFSSVHCLAILGKALIGLEDFKGSITCYESFFEAEKDGSLPVNQTYFYPVYEGAAIAWLALGRLDKARYFAERLQNISVGAPERTYLALSYKLLAEISMKEGDLDKADLHIIQALNIVQTVEVPLATWKVYATAEELYRRRNRIDLVNDFECRKQKAVHQLVSSLQEHDPLSQHFLNTSRIN